MADYFQQDIVSLDESCEKLKAMLDEIASLKTKNPSQSVAR
jgi:hypothetical protein